MAAHPFDHLTPQAVLDALEAVGIRGDGRLLQLNSYENRVFLVHPEEGAPVVAKFYRPGRWSRAQVAEEHAFATELAEAELPVVAPLPLPGATAEAPAVVSVADQTFALAVYPCRSGHGPELEQPDTLRWLGRFIARLHAVGARQPFAHRVTLSPQRFGHAARQRILALDVIPPAERPAWDSRCQQALALVDAAWQAVPARVLRLHGDCHGGNILWRDPDRGGQGPQVVDLDDAVNGPAIQDLWMWLSGDAGSQRGQLAAVLDGYESLRPFDRRELALIEPLRTLRMVHHSAWLAERWGDPAFPIAFPWFGSAGYWSQQALQLGEQIEAMQATADGDGLLH